MAPTADAVASKPEAPESTDELLLGKHGKKFIIVDKQQVTFEMVWKTILELKKRRGEESLKYVRILTNRIAEALKDQGVPSLRMTTEVEVNRLDIDECIKLLKQHLK